MAAVSRIDSGGEKACAGWRTHNKKAKKAHACEVDAARNHFECVRCLKEGKDTCSLLANCLRFFSTDFYFRNFDTKPGDDDKVCTACNASWGHTDCPDQQKRRRSCTSPSNVFGWCGQPDLHRLSWDIENQPYRQPEDHMRYFYQEKPEECAAPWSPLYVRKVIEHYISRYWQASNHYKLPKLMHLVHTCGLLPSPLTHGAVALTEIYKTR
jgi:hypothetical protein